MKSVNVLKKSHFIDYVKFLFKTFSDIKKIFFLEIGIFKKKEKNWEFSKIKKIGNVTKKLELKKKMNFQKNWDFRKKLGF